MPSKYRSYLADFEQWPFIYAARYFLPAGSVLPFGLVPNNQIPILADADFVWRGWSIDMSETTSELVGLSPLGAPIQMGVKFRLAEGAEMIGLNNRVNEAISAYPQVTSFFGIAQIL